MVRARRRRRRRRVRGQWVARVVRRVVGQEPAVVRMPMVTVVGLVREGPAAPGCESLW